MELSVRLARWEMKSMPSGLMAPHVLISQGESARRRRGSPHSQ